MTKLKVLHVITDFYGNGGAEKMLYNVISQNRQCEHHVLSLLNTKNYDDTRHSVCSSVIQLNWNFINSFIILFKVIKILKKMDVSLVQCWMYHSNVMITIANLFLFNRHKVIWNVTHSLADFRSESLPVKISIVLGVMLSWMPKAIIFCSSVSMIQHKKIGYSSKNNVYIPNGVDLSLFQKRKNDFSKNNIVVGAAGRFHKAKGYEYLLGAIKILKDRNVMVNFKLAGNGVSFENDDFSKLLKKSGLNKEDLFLCGEVKNMPDFYNSIDLFVMSSITEGFPNVIIEAMASGVNCIATNVGEVPIVLDNEDMIIPSRDAVILANKIEWYCCLSEAKKNEISINNEINVRKYNISNICYMYYKEWCEIVI